MDVLIAGGTGFIGRNLSRELVDRGHEVTAVSREPDESDVPADVATVAGDVTEYDGLPEIVDGHEAVVNLVALSPLYRPAGGEHRQELVHVGGTRNLVRAMESTGVERLLQQSALGADPDAATAHLRAKGRAEGIVRASDLDWTISRPSVVFGDGAELVPFTRSLTTPYVTALPGGGTTRFQPVWVGDLVDVLAGLLTDDAHVGETHELGGPEVLTLADVTRAIYRADGRPVRILPLPMPLARIGLTLAKIVPFVPFGPDQYRALHLDNTTDENAMDELAPEGGLVTFDTYLAGDISAREQAR